MKQILLFACLLVAPVLVHAGEITLSYQTPSRGFATINLVNVSTKNFGTGNGTVTLKSSFVAGNCVVVFVTGNGNSGVTSITDNTSGGSNTYVNANIKSTVTTPSGNVEVWYSTNVAAGATTVTINTTNTGPQVWIYELSGVVTGQNPFDVTGVTNNGASTTTPAGPSLTTTNTNDYLIETCAFGGTLTGVNSPWTSQTVISGNDSASYAPGATGTYNATFTSGAANAFCSTGVAVLPAPQ